MGRSTFISGSAASRRSCSWPSWPFRRQRSTRRRPLAIPIDLAASPSDVHQAQGWHADAKDDAALAAKPKEPKPKAVKKATPKPPTRQPRYRCRRRNKPKDGHEPRSPNSPRQAEAKKEPMPKNAEASRRQAKPSPSRRLMPKKRDFNADRIAALLNKIPDAAEEAQPVDRPTTASRRKRVKGQSNGTEMTMSVNEIDALRATHRAMLEPAARRSRRRPDRDQAQAEAERGRQLWSAIRPSPIAAASPFFQAAADSAVRAVFQCQPYELPSEKYALWRDMILNFDPSDMYRSG